MFGRSSDYVTKDWADCQEGKIGTAGTNFTTVDGQPVTVVPDLIDDRNQNVVEVKNTNELRPFTQQFRAEAEFAQQRGYTMTLVVDHRTQINDPQLRQMIDSGQIQVVRKELDDNNDI
jgi:hypothetical protein